MEILFFWWRLVGNAWRFVEVDALWQGMGIVLLLTVALIPWLLIARAVERMLYFGESGFGFRWLLRFSLAFGLAGVTSVFLGIGGWLDQGSLLIVYSAVLLIGVAGIVMSRKKVFAVPQKFRIRDLPTTFWIITSVSVLILPAVLYHAAVFPVLQWDSLHYNAPMAKYLYFHGGFPSVVGRSLGFGMDTGYPPLHWSTAAYFYVLLDIPDDIFLRLLSPISFCILLMAGYELGKMWGGRRVAALLTLFIMLTPIAIYGAFQATYNMMLAAWVAMALLFLLRAERDGQWKDWILAGVFIGLAGMTSYNGYYPAALFVGLAVLMRVLQFRNVGFRKVWHLAKKPLVMGLLAFLINTPWWIRNIETFGTPWQPFLSPDPFVFEVSEDRMDKNIDNIYRNVMKFSSNEPRSEEWLQVFFWHPAGIPSVSLLALLGLFAVMRKIREGVYVSGLAIVYWMSPLIQPAHTERHALSFVIGLGLLSALVVNNSFMRWKGRWSQVIIWALLLVVLLVNVSPVVVLGHRYRLFKAPRKTAWSWSQDPSNWVKSKVLESEFSWGVNSWRYINNNLQPGKRVAVAGIPNYYIADGDAARLLYLDSKEALPLHGVGDGEKVRDFFVKNSVQFIYKKGMNWYGFAYDGIEIDHLLGGAEFPEVAPDVFMVKGEHNI